MKLRRFIFLYLAALPFVIAGTAGLAFTVGVTMLVAYPLLAIDHMARAGVSVLDSLSHLPPARVS